MKKIKIVNIVSRLVFGGVESVIYNYYSNMDLNKFELYIITKNDSKKEAAEKFEKLGFKIIYVDDWEKQILKVSKVIKNIFNKYNFDIVHCHLSHTNFYFMMIAKFCHIPVRISHSHLSVKDENILSKLKHKIYASLIKIYSTDLVACGQDAAENLYGKKSNVYIFNNAIDLNDYKFRIETRKEYRKQMQINDDEFCVCNIGRMSYQKNQLFLIDIFKELHSKYKNSKLILIGDGNLKNEIKKRINDYSLSSDVIILNNRNDIPSLLSMVDSFCLPSLYEGLPVVGVEAQAAGLPCYFSNTIDKKVSMSDNCYFLPLENNSKEWADKILENMKKERNDNVLVLTEKGFDIKKEAKKLEKYYINKIVGKE